MMNTRTRRHLDMAVFHTVLNKDSKKSFMFPTSDQAKEAYEYLKKQLERIEEVGKK